LIQPHSYTGWGNTIYLGENFVALREKIFVLRDKLNQAIKISIEL
jgi:hypothetical protein